MLGHRRLGRCPWPCAGCPFARIRARGRGRPYARAGPPVLGSAPRRRPLSPHWRARTPGRREHRLVVPARRRPRRGSRRGWRRPVRLGRYRARLARRGRRPAGPRSFPRCLCRERQLVGSDLPGRRAGCPAGTAHGSGGPGRQRGRGRRRRRCQVLRRGPSQPPRGRRRSRRRRARCRRRNVRPATDRRRRRRASAASDAARR